MAARMNNRVIAISAIGSLALMLAFLLILPALSFPRGRSDIRRIRIEILSLESALAVFQSEYGTFPPSGIVLHGSIQEWEADLASMHKIRHLWPDFDFANCPSLERIPPGGVVLDGAECLVFFLGGMQGDPMSAPLPFKHGDEVLRAQNLAHYEFDEGRLIDRDGDGFREYCDILVGVTPIVYAYNWRDQGFDPADFSAFMKDVYRKGTDTTAPAWGKNGYQLISPGRDRKYGIGGYFSPADDNWCVPASRLVERDNVVNFMPAVLGEVSSK